MSKLGWHFQGLPAWAPGVVNSQYAKLIDPPAENPLPQCRVIGRVYVPDNEANAMVMQGAAGAETWFRHCWPSYQHSPWVWAWEGTNESPVGTPAQRAALVAFTRRWVSLMHAANLRTVALCLSTGWPDVGEAWQLAGALEETDAWAVHEYSAPTMQDAVSWECLRYRRTVAELRAVGARIPPLLITECGIDGGVIGRPKTGWKSYTDRAGYLAQLVWYDGELARDDYVLTATPFTAGPNGDWQDFDVDEELSRGIAEHIRQSVPAPEPEPPPVVVPPVVVPCAASAGIHLHILRPLPGNIGYVSQWFGEHGADYSQWQMIGHNGLDYAVLVGTPVLAAHAGRARVGSDPAGYGTFVRVVALKWETIYGHLDRATIGDGEVVDDGEQIGLSGNTGASTGPHLHLGLKLSKGTNPGYRDWVDPLPYRDV